jgi:hypothetical protein
MKLFFPTRAPFAEPAPLSGKRTIKLLSRLAAKVRIYATAHREAKAAEKVYSRLRWMSDGDLEKLGMTRADVTGRVRRELGSK